MRQLVYTMFIRNNCAWFHLRWKKNLVKHKKSKNIMKMTVGIKFQLNFTILIFWTKFAQKGYFRSKTEKMSITIEFCMFTLVSVPNFSLNRWFWYFGQNLPKKGISGETEKLNSTIDFCIFESVEVPSFSLNWQFWIFGPNLAKKAIFGGEQRNWTPPLNFAYSN